MTQEVHCLECDGVFEEHDEFIKTCPRCGNDDPQQTVYLQTEDEGEAA